jgi:hypothetical protein
MRGIEERVIANALIQPDWAVGSSDRVLGSQSLHNEVLVAKPKDMLHKVPKSLDILANSRMKESGYLQSLKPSSNPGDILF